MNQSTVNVIKAEIIKTEDDMASCQRRLTMLNLEVEHVNQRIESTRKRIEDLSKDLPAESDK